MRLKELLAKFFRWTGQEPSYLQAQVSNNDHAKKEKHTCELEAIILKEEQAGK
jgi:hypothetical protein